MFYSYKLYLFILIFQLFIFSESKALTACSSSLMKKKYSQTVRIVPEQSYTYKDHSGAAVAVATVQVKRPYHEVVKLLEPSNWVQYGGGYFLRAELEDSYPVGSEYKTRLYEIYNDNYLLGGTRIENILNIETQNTEKGRRIDYSLNKSISSSVRIGLVRHSQKGGMKINEGYTEIIRGKNGLHTVTVTKRIYFNLFFPLAPLWTPSFQNSTAVLGLKQMVNVLKSNMMQSLD